MRHRIAVALYLCVGAAVIFTPLTVLTTRGLLELMQTPADIIEDASIYIGILFGGMVTTIFYNMFAGILRAVGDSRSPLLFLTLASLLNVALDLVFIINLHLGVAGAALATVISQGVSAVLCGRFIWRHFPALRFRREELAFRFETVKLLLWSGLPMALQFSVTAIGSITLQWAVNSLGSLVVACVTISNKVQMLGTLPFETLGLVMATFCGQNIGAQKLDRVREGVRKGMGIGLFFALLGGLIVFFGSSTIARLFLSPTQEGLPQLLEYLRRFTRMNAVCFPILGVLMVLRNSLQGLGYSALTMFAGVSELLARAGVSFLLVAPLGFFAITIASPAAWLCADLFLIPAYFVVMKKLSSSLKKGAAQSGTLCK